MTVSVIIATCEKKGKRVYCGPNLAPGPQAGVNCSYFETFPFCKKPLLK